MRQRRYLVSNAPASRAAPFTRGLLAWYPSLPVSAGGMIVRDAGGRYHGTLTNGPKWDGRVRPGGLGPCPNYVSASSQYTDLSALDTALDGLPAFTMAFWTLRVSGGTNTVWRGRGNGEARTGVLWINTNTIYPTVEAAGTSGFGTVLDARTGWVHVAMTFDGSLAATSRVTLYLQGEPITLGATGTWPTTVPTSTGMAIGRYGASGSYATFQDGPTDDVAFWSRALTAAEVAQWYRSSLLGHPAMLRRYSRRAGQVVSGGGTGRVDSADFGVSLAFGFGL